MAANRSRKWLCRQRILPTVSSTTGLQTKVTSPFQRKAGAILSLTLRADKVLLLSTALFLLHYSGDGAEPTNAPTARDEWVVRSWQTEDGLPQNTVNAVLQ